MTELNYKNILKNVKNVEQKIFKILDDNVSKSKSPAEVVAMVVISFKPTYEFARAILDKNKEHPLLQERDKKLLEIIVKCYHEVGDHAEKNSAMGKMQ